MKDLINEMIRAKKAVGVASVEIWTMEIMPIVDNDGNPFILSANVAAMNDITKTPINIVQSVTGAPTIIVMHPNTLETIKNSLDFDITTPIFSDEFFSSTRRLIG